MSYIACIYDAKWWVGLVEEVDKCDNEILVNFMHPFGSSKTFIWPQQEDNIKIYKVKTFNKQFTNTAPYSTNKINRQRPFNQEPSQ